MTTREMVGGGDPGVPERDDPMPGRGRVLIRPMRASDLDEVLGIERASFGLPWSERTFRNLLERRNAVLLVAQEDRLHSPGDPGAEEPAILGYAVLWAAGGEAELGDLAVHPRARRRGIGRGLLARILEEARGLGAEAVFLEVRAGNEPARHLYLEAGFEVAGVRKRYYVKPTEDAVVMRRRLEERSSGEGR